MAAATASLALSSSLPNRKTLVRSSKPLHLPSSVSIPYKHRGNRTLRIVSAVSVSDGRGLPAQPGDLVNSILSKVVPSDGGVLLSGEQHKEVAQAAQELRKYCVQEPVKCPLIFGDWDVVYCSRPESPGGGYRSAVGRLIFKTKEMIQAVEAPDIVRNKVSFSLLGLVGGEVSLKGKLTPLDGEWIQVIFEPPQLKLGGLEFRYGGESEVKLQITYIDEKLRLGIGSRGSLFVFQRRQ